MKLRAVARLAGLALALLASCRAEARPPVLVLTLSDALDPDLLDAFTSETGMPVAVDPYIAPGGIEAALRASKNGYDLLLAPAASLGTLESRLGPLGTLQEAATVEPALMASVGEASRLAVPFDWYPIGLAVDEARLRASGLEAASGMAMLVRPELLRKAGACGLGVPDRPLDLYGVLAAAAGPDADRRRALALLAQLRPVARRAADGELAGGLAQGDLCAALLPAPAAAMAVAAARAADAGAALTFVVPDRSTIAVDVLALPLGGRNPEGGRALLRFLLAPDHAATNARYGHVASALRGSPAPPDGLFDPTVLPRLVLPPPVDAALGRAIEAEWRRGAAR